MLQPSRRRSPRADPMAPRAPTQPALAPAQPTSSWRRPGTGPARHARRNCADHRTRHAAAQASAGCHPGMKSFFTPPVLGGRELTLEEAVRIGLDNAPKTSPPRDCRQPRGSGSEALSPLLPQLSGQWGGIPRIRYVRTTDGRLNRAGAGPRADPGDRDAGGDDARAWSPASLLLFDFGQTAGGHGRGQGQPRGVRAGGRCRAAEADHRREREDASLFTLLLAKRLVVDINAGPRSRDAEPEERAGILLESARSRKSFVTRAEVDVATRAGEPDPGPERGGPGAAVAQHRAWASRSARRPRSWTSSAYEPYQVDSEVLVTEALSAPAESRHRGGRPTRRRPTSGRNSQTLPNIVASGHVRRHARGVHRDYNYGVQLTWSIFDGGNMDRAVQGGVKRQPDAFPGRASATRSSRCGGTSSSPTLTMISARAADRRRAEGGGLGPGELPAEPGALLTPAWPTSSSSPDAQLALTQAQSTPRPRRSPTIGHRQRATARPSSRQHSNGGAGALGAEVWPGGGTTADRRMGRAAR